MKNIYSGADSDYKNMAGTWHVEDSPWKATQIHNIITKNNLTPKKIVEVGCGVGEILYCLNEKIGDKTVQYEGYDIAIDAINIANKKQEENVKFYCEDFTTLNNEPSDVLLMIDVFEHIPDYIGFIEKCNSKARYKIFHIPLDLHVSGLLRKQLPSVRKSIGHLHYFSKETALATLEDTGLKIIDYAYTDGSSIAKSLKTKLAYIPRKVLYPIMPDFTVKLLGGYSLLVLTE